LKYFKIKAIVNFCQPILSTKYELLKSCNHLIIGRKFSKNCDEIFYFTFRNFSLANKTTLFGLCDQQKRQKSNCRFAKWNGGFKNIAKKCLCRPTLRDIVLDIWKYEFLVLGTLSLIPKFFFWHLHSNWNWFDCWE